MSRRKNFDDDSVRKLRPKDGPLVADPLSPGYLFVRINQRSKAFTVVARGPDGIQKWATIGPTDHITIDKARIEAAKIVARIKAGETPKEPAKPKPQTLDAVAADWLDIYVVPNKLRSEKEIRRRLNSFMLPRLGARDFASIKRSDIAPLLDHVVKVSGARSADQVLGDFRGLALFYAGRNDNYVSPLIRGMKRGENVRRDRVLNHEEIRMLWRAADDGSRFGAVVKVLLLTAQRLSKVLGMRWDNIDGSIWNIPQESRREKNTGGALPLSGLALDIIEAQTRLAASPFVFPAFRGQSHLTSAGVLKRQFVAKLAAMGWNSIARESGVEPGWTLHDLRRTARTLLSEIKIDHNDAERVLGHVVGSSIAQIYDRFAFVDEKRRALVALAFFIERMIVDPYQPTPEPAKPVKADDNVVALFGT